MKKKKDKWMFAGAVVVILAVSILTSNVNLMDEVTGLVKGIWTGTQDVLDKSAEVETLASGTHVEILGTDAAYVREIYEVLGEIIDEDQAVEMLKEMKALAYYGKEQGVAASSKEKKALKEDLKTKMKESDESQYNRVVRRYGKEKDYWKILDDTLGEYIIAEKMKENKREELENKVDVDVEKELQEYIDELVGYEKFK